MTKSKRNASEKVSQTSIAFHMDQLSEIALKIVGQITEYDDCPNGRHEGTGLSKVIHPY